MANYHVSYISGSDVTGAGTTANPWGTVKFALDTATPGPGDTVKVEGNTLTTVDAGATIASVSSTTVLTTSTDLSGQFIAGDIIQVNPNIPGNAEFDGWMFTEVVSVTAGTLTTRMKWAFPNQTTLTISIRKVDNQVDYVQENLTPPIGAGCIVEGGYDATFTSIIGHTFFINLGLSAGSRSGTQFNWTANDVGRWLNKPTFKNMAFMKLQNAFNCAFGGMVRAQDIIQLNTNTSYNGALVQPDGDTEVRMYMNDCDGGFVNSSFYPNNYDGYDANAKPYRIWNNASVSRFNDINYIKINGIVGYANSAGDFAFSPLFRDAKYTSIDGPVTLIGRDYTTASGYQIIPTIVQTALNADIKLSSVNIVLNGIAANIGLWTPLNGQMINTILRFPSGFLIKDQWWYGRVNLDQSINGGLTLIDDNGTWTGPGNSVATSNTVDQETGNSCLDLLMGVANGYAAAPYSGIIATFPSKVGATALTGLTLRVKRVSSTNPAQASSTQVFSKIGLIEYLSSGFSISTIDVWETKIVSFTGNIGAAMGNRDQNILFTFKAGQAAEKYNILIDSITPIYS